MERSPKPIKFLDTITKSLFVPVCVIYKKML